MRKFSIVSVSHSEIKNDESSLLYYVSTFTDVIIKDLTCFEKLS